MFVCRHGANWHRLASVTVFLALAQWEPWIAKTYRNSGVSPRMKEGARLWEEDFVGARLGGQTRQVVGKFRYLNINSKIAANVWR